MRMSAVVRRSVSVSGALAILLSAPETTGAATYAVRVRWQPSASAGVTGYRVWTRALGGPGLPALDAALPAPATDGSLAADVSGLDGRTDYVVTVTAYAAAGDESLPSNAIAIGYVQVAGRIDSDGDGLTDAAEDPNLNRVVDAGETDALRADSDGDGVGDASDACRGTPAGAAANPAGCSCAQVTCDDANPCNGAESCSAGICRPGTAPACDDGGACTDDACDPQVGCTHAPRPGCCARDADCADADACTTDEWCEAGTCRSVPVTCAAPGDSCQLVRCSPEAGCVIDSLPDGTACDDADACTLGDTCLAGVCRGESDAPRRGPRGVGIRRFRLAPHSAGYDVRATAYVAFPTSIDIAIAGVTVTVEDGMHRPVLAADLAGVDFAVTRAGWELRPGGGVDRLEVRPATGTARVSLRGTLPGFALVDATGASVGAGTIFWRVRFGAGCSSVFELACTDSARGARRCRRALASRQAAPPGGHRTRAGGLPTGRLPCLREASC